MALLSVVRQAVKQSITDKRVYYVFIRNNELCYNLYILKPCKLVCHVCGKEIIKNA